MFSKKIAALYFLVFVIVLAFAGAEYFILKPKFKEERHYLYDAKLELKRLDSKAKLVDSVQVYINKVAPTSSLSALVLINSCINEKVDLLFVLAQGQFESHYGTCGLAAKTNSVFNVGAYDGLKEHHINKKFIYSHVNESIKPYLKLINKDYLIDNKTEEDLLKSFVNKDKKRYASYTKYEEELSLIYNRLSKTPIKTLYDEYKYYNNELNY